MDLREFSFRKLLKYLIEQTICIENGFRFSDLLIHSVPFNNV